MLVYSRILDTHFKIILYNLNNMEDFNPKSEFYIRMDKYIWTNREKNHIQI
jgi:hypothetical protein